MLDRSLRRLKDAALDPLARSVGRRVHPDAISLAAFAVGLGAAALLYRQAYAAGLALWLLSRVLDGLDGAVARAHSRQTDFGGYLDILLDFALYALLPIAIALGQPDGESLPALAFLLGSFFVNAASWMYLSAILEKGSAGAMARGELTTVAMPGGLIEGAETIVFYSLFIVLPGRLGLLFALMAALVTLTAAQRLAWAHRHLREPAGR